MRMFMNQTIYMVHCCVTALYSITLRKKPEVRTFFTQNLLSSFPVSCANDVTELNFIYRKQRVLPVANFSDDLIDMFLSCKDLCKIAYRLFFVTLDMGFCK